MTRKQKTIKAAFEPMAEKVSNGRFENLEHEILILKEHCQQIRGGQSIIVPIETLAPEPFVLKRPIQVIVRPSDGEYLATFFDANIGMGGDTEEEAISNLKAIVIDTFEQLELNEASLGPEPMRQLAVLRELIQRR